MGAISVECTRVLHFRLGELKMLKQPSFMNMIADPPSLVPELVGKKE